MSSFLTWIKTHKFVSILIVIIIYFVGKDLFGVTPLMYNRSFSPGLSFDSPSGVSEPVGLPSTSQSFQGEFEKTVSTTLSDGRLVVKNSQLSLVAKDVQKIGDMIISYAKQQGGFMVEASFTRPNESPFASITVRVPTEKLDDSLKYFKSLSQKVTSENLVGTDVTEQYTDIEGRLATQRQILTKFQEILIKATSVQDILTVQQNIISVQQQIDALIGQQQALEKNAELSRVTVYLSSDELALPYTPDTAFRPNIVFKLAVRSVLNSLRQVAEIFIWIGVYGIIWIPAIFLFVGVKRWKEKKIRNTSTPSNQKN